MTITAWDIYWITRLDNLQFICAMAAAAAGIAASWGLLECFHDFGDEERGKWLIKRFAPAFFVAVLVTALIPSTKSAAAMYVVPAIVNSEAVQTIPAELTAIVKDWLKDLHKESK